MQKRTEREVLETLIRINDTRINVYSKYIMSSGQPDKMLICNCMISESEHYIEELTRRLQQVNEAEQIAECAKPVAIAIWQHLCDKVGGIGSLSLCEMQEMIVLKCYEEALLQSLDNETKWLIAGQQKELKVSYKLLKCYSNHPTVQSCLYDPTILKFPILKI